MKRHDKAPNGHFAEGLILYGNLETGAMASQGFLLEPPDLQHASIGVQNDYQDKLRIFLSTLGPKQRAQLQWTCNSDYQKELIRYHQQTATVTDEYVREHREERFSRYWQRMTDYYTSLVKEHPERAVRAFMLNKMFKHEAELRVVARQAPQAKEWLEQQEPSLKQRVMDRLEKINPFYREKALVRVIAQEKTRLDFSQKPSVGQGMSV